ncbi:hypothetical protein LCGC14_2556130 [marine sediment metagenome]|uniref:Uncharacterized protein n=1 Tax=marine sediment metagenome TaxID=412755 RepID=A0A0F9B9D4_9ZZZZ
MRIERDPGPSLQGGAVSEQNATVPTTADILSAIRRLHLGNQWAFFEELRIGTGYGQGREQRMDAFACGLWSKNWGSMAYEVKTTRADFRREIKAPLKRRMALRYSNLYWFVTPQGLTEPSELPIETGLMEVHWATVSYYSERKEGWIAKVVVPAPWRDVPPPTWSLFCAVARRVASIEQNGASA